MIWKCTASTDNNEPIRVPVYCMYHGCHTCDSLNSVYTWTWIFVRTCDMWYSLYTKLLWVYSSYLLPGVIRSTMWALVRHMQEEKRGGMSLTDPRQRLFVLNVLVCRCCYSRAADSKYWCSKRRSCCVACLLLALKICGCCWCIS